MLFFTFLFLAVGDWMLRNGSEERQTWDILKSVCDGRGRNRTEAAVRMGSESLSHGKVFI